MMDSKTWWAILNWLMQMDSMDVVRAVDDDDAEDALSISIHAHANRDNYFHTLRFALEYPVYTPMYFANDEYS